MTIWSPFALDTDKMEPSAAAFMLNFRVADLDTLLAALRAEGCNVLDSTESSDFGKFGWVIDPDGNKVELWSHRVGNSWLRPNNSFKPNPLRGSVQFRR
ncbi:VOC family protein [Pseudomonas sp. Hp2]|uniref:VOC family protein n=1 Tax=Pseudomonas sp. Hp2 TaxID=701189 RepID=UPI001C49A2B9|nr:hypothetical protein [Pseudomonas sp. Hp2]